MTARGNRHIPAFGVAKFPNPPNRFCPCPTHKVFVGGGVHCAFRQVKTPGPFNTKFALQIIVADAFKITYILF
jgi:hypothetical protein